MTDTNDIVARLRALAHSICGLELEKDAADALERQQVEIERLRAGLERLSCPRTFDLPGIPNTETRVRMFYADQILLGSDNPEKGAWDTMRAVDRAVKEREDD